MAIDNDNMKNVTYRGLVGESIPEDLIPLYEGITGRVAKDIEASIRDYATGFDKYSEGWVAALDAAEIVSKFRAKL